MTANKILVEKDMELDKLLFEDQKSKITLLEFDEDYEKALQHIET